MNLNALFLLLAFALNTDEGIEKKINKYKTLDYTQSQIKLNGLFHNEIYQHIGSDCRVDSQNELAETVHVLYLLSYYTHNSAISDLFHKCFFKRKNPNKEEIKNAFGIAIKGRNGVVAKKIKDLFEESIGIQLPVVPEIIDKRTLKGEGKRLLKLNKKKSNSFFVKDFDYSKKKEMIVFFDPKCHFSNSLMRSIESNDFFKKMFSNHSTWIQVAHQSLSYDSLLKWNEKHPKYKLYSEATTTDFMNLDKTAIPVIFIVEDGVVLEELRGWPKSDRSEELTELLKKHF